MSKETTFVIIKPNAMKKNAIGAIMDKFEKNHFRVIGAKLIQISEAQCKEFYVEHKERPFFNDLVEFMTSSPVFLMALSCENAVKKARDIMGATNPEEAADGTVRKIWGDNVGENAIHGSDSLESAQRELALFFAQSELING